MATIQTSPQVLDRHYLEIRCGLLDLAAALIGSNARTGLTPPARMSG